MNDPQSQSNPQPKSQPQPKSKTQSHPETRPTFQDRLEYLSLRLMGLLMGALPRPLALGLAWPLGVFAFDIVRIRRRVTLENLAQAFPDRSPAERRRIGRGAFINLAVVAVEMLRARHLTREKVLSLVHMDEESEALHHRIMKEGKGAVFVGGHYSTWELMAARLAATGYPTLIIVQQQRNPLVNRDLAKSRDRLGFHLVDRGKAVRYVLSMLKEGGVVGILADQDAGPRFGIFIDFFGRPASTYQGPAGFALRCGAPLVGAWIHREGISYTAGYRRLDEEALVGLPPDADEETRIRRLTEAYVQWFEERIRMDPDQYFWLHRRWKTRPEQQTEKS